VCSSDLGDADDKRSARNPELDRDPLCG